MKKLSNIVKELSSIKEQVRKFSQRDFNKLCGKVSVEYGLEMAIIRAIGGFK